MSAVSTFITQNGRGDLWFSWSLFRSDFDNNPGDLRRSNLFFHIASKLKVQTRWHGPAVVVTNQVVDVVGSDGVVWVGRELLCNVG
ncbi:hypothetical protein QJS10_CPA05g00925 [Acorus calamus]|uniref:Uncharacterized protein n=1 Tax=Acorus calamus TaxID=4465 RepID=A0AAV9EUM4_ACOCL|nr:hypothetical protein QJS10_CPA05g00925 [Acorus calamus]